MTDLKPCPFCGGEARRSNETFERTILSWVYCAECGAAGGYRHTEAEAIEEWNNRAQTVFGLTLDEVRQMMKRDAERERTCENVDEYATAGFFICGACGFGEGGIELTPNYCPNCGRKVVGE